MHGQTARLPVALGGDAAAGARHARPHGIGLVDPGAGPIAVDPGGAQIADPLQRGAAAQIGKVVREHRVSCLVGGDRGEQMRGAGKRGRRGPKRPVPLELVHLEAFAGKARLLLGIARGAGDVCHNRLLALC